MKKNYLLLLLLLLVFSCKDGYLSESPGEESNPGSSYNFGNAVQRNFQGVVLDTGGMPVSGATVTIGSNTVTTDNKGLFVFKNVSVSENFAHVKVTKAGYVNASRVMVPTDGMNRINIMMIPVTTTAAVSAGSASTVALPDGTQVKFDGSFKDANGNAYSGTVKVSLYHLAPSNTYLNELMPGSFLATNATGNARAMETFGMLHVQLTGSSGQNLQIANGHTAEITIPIDATQTSNSPATIPLWSYNETTGMWNEEGTASKVGNAYVGAVSHFSWWNCDIQFPQATIKVHVKTSSGQALPNLVVTLKRMSQAYDVYGSTDNAGMVSGIVPAGEILTLKVYDACHVVIYTANIGPFTAGSTIVLPDILLPIPPSLLYTIKGSLKTCANANVTDGYVVFKTAGAGNYFQYMSVPVDNAGNFTFNTYSCTANPQFTYEGLDINNLQTTNEVAFTATANLMNLGNITVCNPTSEFIIYKIDNQTMVTVLGSFDAKWSGLTSSSPNIPVKQLRISSMNPAGSYFSIVQNNMLGAAASFTTDYLIVVAGTDILPGNGNMMINISSFGTVGDYIDFTVNGTYTNTSGSHTLTATGHVKRDL